MPSVKQRETVVVEAKSATSVGLFCAVKFNTASSDSFTLTLMTPECYHSISCKQFNRFIEPFCRFDVNVETPNITLAY